MQISCSILSSNDRLQSIKNLNSTSVDYLHIDVMDGKFVNNTNFPIAEINDCLIASTKPADIHLMVETPMDYIRKLDNPNIYNITIHEEITQDITPIIKAIKQKGYQVGISLKPHTPIDHIIPYLSTIDLILIMSVEPGYGHQAFLPSTITKLQELTTILKNYPHIQVEVDGGINDQTIQYLHQNAVDIAVVGSYITSSGNYNTQIKKLQEETSIPLDI